MLKIAPIAGALCATLMFTAAAQAESNGSVARAGFVEESGGSARINLAGKLRMLSQRIPAAACAVKAGLVADESQAVLDGAVAEFHQILAALEFGDDSIGVFGAEERARTLRVIQELHTKFDPIEAALEDSVAGVPSDAAMQIIADNNTAVLEMAKLLVVEISGEYASPVALRQSDAMAIDIAGRQRMLTQQISKYSCQISSGLNATSSRDTLASTVQIFEASLQALRNGMPTVGLEEPPTDEIAAGLDVVKSDWLEVKTHIDAIDAGENLSDADRAAIFVGLNTTMADMNKVVGMYSDASKLGF